MTGKKHRANCDHHDKLAELEAWLLRWKDKGSQDGPGARQDKDDEHDPKKNEDGGTGSAMAVANLKVPKAPKNPVAGLEEDPMAHLLKEFEGGDGIAKTMSKGTSSSHMSLETQSKVEKDNMVWTTTKAVRITHTVSEKKAEPKERKEKKSRREEAKEAIAAAPWHNKIPQKWQSEDWWYDGQW